jgi:hypothetical protein
MKRWTLRLLAFCLLVTGTLVAPRAALADPLAYAITSAGGIGTGSTFGIIDLSNGAFTQIGPTYAPGYLGIATVSGTVFATDGINNLVSIDRTTGIPTVIGNSGVALVSAAASGGPLYGVGYPDNNLYSVNTGNGAATHIGPTGLPVISGFFANSFSVSNTALYYTYEDSSNVSSLYTLDPTTGNATLVGLTGTTNLVGSGFIDNTLYAFSPNAIYTIDTTTGAASFVTNTSVEMFGATAVPEPTGFVILACGAACVFGYRWRRGALVA